MTPILETKRLILRPVTMSDAPAAQAHFNNWNVIKNMGPAVPWPYPDDGVVDFWTNNLFPRLEKGEALFWAITLREKDEMVGAIEFRHQANGEGNRGFWLAEHLWGRGLMTEAVAAVNDYVFDVLKVEEIMVANVDFNAASRALKIKSGAELIETVKKPGAGGQMRETEIWRLTRNAWHRARTANI